MLVLTYEFRKTCLCACGKDWNTCSAGVCLLRCRASICVSVDKRMCTCECGKTRVCAGEKVLISCLPVMSSCKCVHVSRL